MTCKGFLDLLVDIVLTYRLASLRGHIVFTEWIEGEVFVMKVWVIGRMIDIPLVRGKKFILLTETAVDFALACTLCII